MGRARKYRDPVIVSQKVERLEKQIVDELGLGHPHIYALGVSVAVEVDCRSNNPRLDPELLADYLEVKQEEMAALRDLSLELPTVRKQAGEVKEIMAEGSTRRRLELAAKGEEAIGVDDDDRAEAIGVDDDDAGIVEEEDEDREVGAPLIETALERLLTPDRASNVYKKFYQASAQERRENGDEILFMAAEARKLLRDAPGTDDIFDNCYDVEVGKAMKDLVLMLVYQADTRARDAKRR